MLKQVMIVLIVFAVLVEGVISVIVSVDRIKNYDNPALFGITFGAIGLAIGMIAAIKIRPFMVTNPKIQSNFYLLAALFSYGVMGNILLGSQVINSSVSHLQKCEQLMIIDKEHREPQHKKFTESTLTVEIGGRNHRLFCSYRYWRAMTVGQKVNVCFYSSPIGFGYITLPDEKREGLIQIN